jgi:hypothetical protein
MAPHGGLFGVDDVASMLRVRHVVGPAAKQAAFEQTAVELEA